jgi:hypothetical protein
VAWLVESPVLFQFLFFVYLFGKCVDLNVYKLNACMMLISFMLCVYIYIYIYIYMYVYIYIYIYMCVCVCVYIYIYIYCIVEYTVAKFR